MEKRMIGLGLVAGLLAGIASFVYARVQVAPLIAAAIGYEEARSHAETSAGIGHSHDHEVFTRGVQENLGAAVGTIGFSVVTGCLFAVAVMVALAVLRRHRRVLDHRRVAVLLACGAFISTSVIPWVAYPATLPGIGDPETAGARTSAYLVVLVVSIILAVSAAAAAVLSRRIGGWSAGVLAAAGYLVSMSVVIAVLPAYRETPEPLTGDDGTTLFPGFPADLLADFRTTTILCQAVLWCVLASVFVVLLPRVLHIPVETSSGKEDSSAHR